MTLTEADLRGAGFTDAGLIGENTGTFTFTLVQDETWTMAQSTDRPIRWPVFRGTWTVPGPGSIEMRTEFPQDYAGEVVTVRWTVGTEGLRLEVMSPPDPLIKAQLETHPWARSP
jgi:hypothetical protein